jgi:hypothetical protein
MAALLDLVAAVIVVAAIAFLLWPRRARGCTGCAPQRRGGAETRIALSQLRATARQTPSRD